MHSPEYEARFRRPDWEVMRRWYIGMADYRCTECGQRKQPLQLHHLTYDRLGREAFDDLVVLCRDCHMARHSGHGNGNGQGSFW